MRPTRYARPSILVAFVVAIGLTMASQQAVEAQGFPGNPPLTKVTDVHVLCRPLAAWDAGVAVVRTPVDAGFSTIMEVALVPEPTCTETVYFFHKGMTKLEVKTRGSGGARGVGHANGNAYVEGPVKGLAGNVFCAIASDGGCWVAGQVGQ